MKHGIVSVEVDGNLYQGKGTLKINPGIPTNRHIIKTKEQKLKHIEIKRKQIENKNKQLKDIKIAKEKLRVSKSTKNQDPVSLIARKEEKARRAEIRRQLGIGCENKKRLTRKKKIKLMKERIENAKKVKKEKTN